MDKLSSNFRHVALGFKLCITFVCFAGLQNRYQGH